jgi:acyl carrier protein
MDEALRARIQNRKLVLDGIKDELVDRLQLEVQPPEIDDDTFLFGGGLQLDSIDSMEIIIGMQARFGVEVPEGELAPLRTINTLADLVESNRNRNIGDNHNA